MVGEMRIQKLRRRIVARVLVVDDEKSIRITLREFLKKDKHSVVIAEDAKEAEVLLKKENFDVLVTDIVLPMVTGLELIQISKRVSPDTQIILITGEPNVDTAIKAVKFGVFDYLVKPITREKIQRNVANATKVKFLKDERIRLEKENQNYQNHLEQLVKERTKSLQESEEQWRALTENSQSHIMLLNLDMEIEFINHAVSDLTKEEVIGKSILDFTPPDYHHVAIEYIEQVIKSGKADRYETMHISDEGGAQYFGVHISPVRDEKGNITGLISSSNNITECKQAEEKIKDSEELLRLATQTAEIGITNTDLISGKIVWDDTCYKIHGYELKTPITLDLYFSKIIHPNEQVGVVPEYQAALDSTDIRFRSEYRIIRPDGTERWLNEDHTIIRDKSGKAIRTYSAKIDITERKRMEEELKESELRLKILVNSSPNIILFKDGKSRWLIANDSTIEVFVLENVDFYGKTDVELVDVTDPIYKESFLACSITDEEAWRKGTILQTEEIIPTADGMKRIYDIIKVPLFEDNGERKGLLITGHDVTERKNVEEALRSSEELYKNVFNNSPLGIFHFDDCGVITDCNDEFVKIIGSSLKELIGLNMLQNLKDQKFQNAVKSTLESGCGYYNDYYSSVTAIKTTPIVIRFRAIYNKNKIIGGVALVEDITERKQNELEIEKLLNAVEQSHSSIVITDADGIIEYVNKYFTEVTGYSKEEAIGKNPNILKTDYLDASVYENMWRTISNGNTWDGEFYNKKKNGEFYWEKAIISPIKDSDGKIINYVAIKEDITDKKKTEEVLKEKMDKLERFNRVMVDRELKMIELKKEINELLEKNGKTKKYKVKE